MTGFRVLQNDDELALDIQALSTRIPAFGKAYALTGPIALRKSEGVGAEPLMRAIIGQQISVAAARGVWNKFEAAGFTDLAAIRAASFDALRAAGLSRQKAGYMQALAMADIDFSGLAACENVDVEKKLIEVKGIGRWTAEIYLMFSLGRADVFAPGDLALQEAARLLFDLETRPKESEMRKMAEAWSPYRTAAAHVLWAYYHVKKDRQGIDV